MVHLSPSLTLTPPPDLRHCGDGLPEHHLTMDHLTSPKRGSADGEGELEQMEVYPGYEGYIENGLICLKHKVRNLEKKKLKLEEYKLRLKGGLVLNKDQLASVEKYEEVIHHLSLARELHRTLDSLTHNLLRAQRKAVKKQQVQRAETERRRLCSVLQFQYVLRSLDRDGVQSDLVSGLNQAPKVPPQTIQSLKDLSPLLGLTRDHLLSVSAQMERAAGLFLDLLDGKDSPVADSTFASLKEELCVLVLSPYFSSLPPEPEPSKRSSTPSAGDALKSELPESSSTQSVKAPPPDPAPAQTWDSGAQKDQEPPDHWDAGYTDQSSPVGKPWRGGAALVLKTQSGARRPGDSKRKERRARREEPFKQCVDLQMPMEVLTLPTDPELRRRRLEELLTNVNGAFSFVQDSVLDGAGSPSGVHHQLRRRASGCPSPLAQSNLRSPGELIPKTLHSSPLPGRLQDHKPSLTNGDSPGLEPQDVGLVSNSEKFSSLFCTEPSVSAIELKRPLQSPVSVKPPLSRTPPTAQSFTTPPSRRALPPSHFNNMNAVFKVNPSLPPSDFSKAEPRPRFSSVSTQTPPEFDTSDEESHEVHDYFLSPSQSGGRPAHYQRPARGGWSDISLDSTLELGALDSGHGASLSAPALTSSGLEESLLQHPSLAPPDAPHAAPVLPLPLYPLRVAFTASRTANFAPGNLDQPIVFDQMHSNAGEMYDARIGRFTCPVDGTYVFLFHILKLAVNVPLYVNLMRNEEVMVSAYANDGAPDHETASNHAILPLFRGDQVWLRLHRGAIYGSTWKYSTFSGFLLYQD